MQKRAYMRKKMTGLIRYNETFAAIVKSARKINSCVH